MDHGKQCASCATLFLASLACATLAYAADSSLALIGKDQCSAARLGSSIDAQLIGEPVAAVTLAEPQWTEATGNAPTYCLVKGTMAPVDRSPTARAIQFAVALPVQWNRIGMHLGGGGMNGVIPPLTGGNSDSRGKSALAEGIVTYGSDSGHSNSETAWATNDEAIKNIGYLQLKKTHDAAMVIMQRMYGEKPRFNYFVGTSQGGREGLTVAQRYPMDYDGVASNVPIVNFSGLMLGPIWTRVHEKSLANWVPANKGKAIVAEFMRQCDGLDGLVDGVISDYLSCRETFNVRDGKGTGSPWAAKHCPGNVDPDPKDDTVNACFTDAQIGSLNFVFSTYRYDPPLANRNHGFGMWAPTTDTGGGGARGALASLFTDARFRGQESAAADAPVFSSIGILGVTGFLMRDLQANPIDYQQSSYASRHRQISAWLDSTNPDLSAFRRRGGKLIVAIGTNDTIASSGAQLDYYQSLLDKMGRKAIDSFARLYVLPQTGHGLTGSSYTVDGNGRSIAATEIPSRFDRVTLLRDWVEKGIAPAESERVTGTTGSRPMCSYPKYPRYVGGDATQAAAYACTMPR
jgi:feruloyl esterase